jgi:ATP-binding cassette subfamily F protein 3
MIILSTSDLSLSFGQHKILERITFGVSEGDRIGIIGVNGAGKTSLFRLITGEYTPDSGSVTVAHGKTVGMLRQNTDLSSLGDATLLGYMLDAFPELTALEGEIAELELRLPSLSEEEAVAAGARLARLHREFSLGGGLEYRARCRSTLLRLGFSEEQLSARVADLSGGQHTRLALGRLLAREPDILMLDEPTNHLDVDALIWLEEYLRSYRKTVLLISHDRYFLDRTTTKTLLIEHCRAILYHGSYTAAKEQQMRDAASLEHRYKEQQKVIARIRANIEFQRRCNREHNFVTIRSKEKQLERMEKITLAPPPPRDIRMSFRGDGSTANDVLRVKDLSFAYPGGPTLIDRLSLLVERGERVLFLGANGCGKSTLMKLIAGKLKPLSGVVETGHRITVGYYDQENRGLDESKTVMAELHDAFPAKPDGEIRSILALFLFSGDDVFKEISALSGGERARLTLAKLMLREVSLLVLDEPTNHLDIGSREALETAIAAFDGTVIAVSHDRYFIDRVATRIIELDRAAESGAISYRLEDTDSAYTAYLGMREAARAAAPAPTAAPAQPSDAKLLYEQKKRENAERRAAERRLERAKQRIPELEAELERLESELYGEAAQNYIRAAEIEERKGEIEEELLSLYELTMS